jgi:hypothetical protein
MSTPVWVTPSGSLGTIPQGVFYNIAIVATAESDTVYYKVIAGVLPPGIFIDETGILSGSPNAQAQVEGIPLPVARETTDTFVVRAYTQKIVNGITVVSGLADRTFSLTISRQSTVVWITPAGQIAQYIDGTQVTDLQLRYNDTSVYGADVVTLIGGALPPGLSLSTKGVISGYITPDPNATVVETSYSFTLKVSNGVSNDVKTFSILVYARSLITADNTVITADNTFITADIYPLQPPIITTPIGSIGSTRSDNFFAFQFTGQDFGGNSFEFIATSALPPGLTLDPNSGWLYGYIPFGGVQSTVYNFDILVAEVNNSITGASGTGTTATLTFATQSTAPYSPGNTISIVGISPGDYNGTYTVTACTTNSVSYASQAVAPYVSGGVITSNFSQTYSFSLTITGPVNTDVLWLTPSNSVELAKTPSNLGLIDNGDTSTFYVAAQNVSGIPLQYRLLSGSNSRLPQGLQLLPSGHIAGRVSFDTFALDGGTTVFDVGLNTVTQPTTFDMVATFTVNAFSGNGLVNVNKTFSITVVRRYQEPYDNLYIQAMPPESDRALLNQLLQDPTIFPPDLLYRNDDPYFGVATRVIYNHAYGLTAGTINEYVASLDLNHYWKKLVLGEIKTARALDDAGNILYEVVYSKVIDDLVNNQGTSVGKEVTLPYSIDVNGSMVDMVYPDSLQDMRDQVVEVVGQVSTVLPRWMLSRQADGSVLGFTPAWVIAYTNPGASGQIAYNIQTLFGNQLNLINFTADRYELDNFLTKNWNREHQYWGYIGDTVTPHPPSITIFDVATPPLNTLATWENDANVITTWEDNYHTLATWTYATPGANNLGTTFDNNSLLFTAPVDMYSPPATTEYDKYLVFPKRNILE